MRTTEKSLGQYVHESNGRIYEVIEHTSQIDSSSLAGRRQPLEGTKGYVTTSGVDLNQLDDELIRFELIQEDGIITRQTP